MNLLSPDDCVPAGMQMGRTSRRKSLCNGALLAMANVATGCTVAKKKDRTRRGSLSEPPCRRGSLVQRFFFMRPPIAISSKHFLFVFCVVADG